MIHNKIAYYVAMDDGSVCAHTHRSLSSAQSCRKHHEMLGEIAEIWYEQYRETGALLTAGPVQEEASG